MNQCCQGALGRDSARGTRCREPLPYTFSGAIVMAAPEAGEDARKCHAPPLKQNSLLTFLTPQVYQYSKTGETITTLWLK